MNMQRRAVGIGLVLSILGCVALIFVIRAPEAAKVTVSYLGVTNGHSRVFSLENQSHSAVEYLVGLPQVKTNGAWSRVQLVGDSRGMSTPTILAAGGRVTLQVEEPAERSDWRLPVMWYVQGRGEWIDIVSSLRMNHEVLKTWWPQRKITPYPGFHWGHRQYSKTSFSPSIVRNENIP